MNQQHYDNPTVVGEASIVTVLIHQNCIKVSTIHTGCCRIPYQYLMNDSKDNNCVHFIDCINLSQMKDNCTGTMCIFRTKVMDNKLFSDWNLGIVLYLSQFGLIIYKFENLSCFANINSDLNIETYLSSKKTFSIQQILENEIEIQYINQLSGKKMFKTESCWEQFKLVWDKESTYVQCSPEGPDVIPFSKFINGNNRIHNDWERCKMQSCILVQNLPPAEKRKIITATKKRKRKSSHPFDYQLNYERENLKRQHFSCYYDESTCSEIPRNKFYAVPFTDCAKNMNEEIVLSYLPSDALNHLLRLKHIPEEEHNEFLYENGCWFETVRVHQPDEYVGGITYAKVNNNTDGTAISTIGEYHNNCGVVVSHWMKHSSKMFEKFDFELFVKVKDHIYNGFSFERNVFSKVGCNIYSGMLCVDKYNFYY